MSIQDAGADALSHIPGRKGLPYLGVALDFVRDPYAMGRRQHARYGDVSRTYMLGGWSVSLAGADAVEYVLTDPDRIFSSRRGWRLLTELFPGGLMLRDHEDHRAHRRVMQPAFRAAAMQDYLDRMNGGIAALLPEWGARGELRFYPAIKELTLKLGAAVFMGLPLDGAEAARLNRAFQDEVAASLALVRAPLPLTTYRRGLEGRRYLTREFARMIPERRATPGADFFSQMVGDDTGWSETEIIDHLNFLMMAAHDTTTSALTTMIGALVDHSEWQDAIRAEIGAIGGDALRYEDAGRMEITDRVFREALRLRPPVPFIPRRAEADFVWQGVAIPAGAHVGISPGLVMMSEEWWSDPERFDPDRFAPDRAEDRRHRFAWAPFGGGAHKCIGLHFAVLQAKAFAFQFLRAYRVEKTPATDGTWARVPIPRPRNGLPVRLVPLGAARA